MTESILVTGGTGTLGRQVVALLRSADERIRVLSRSMHRAADGVEYVRGDLATDTGIGAAVTGIDTVVHCAGSAKGDEDKIRHLVNAAVPAGVRHLVNVSVVGADRIPVANAIDRAMFGYFAMKLGTERIVAASGIPWTTLRATQFHDLILTTARALAKSPVMPVFSGVRFQPVDSADVAARVVELACADPAGLAPELGGPHAYEMTELMHSYLKAADKRRLLLQVRAPGAAAQAMRAGANLTLDHANGARTWEDFLAEHVRPNSAA